MLGRLVSGLLNTLPAISSSSIRQLSTIFNAAPAISKTIAGGGWSLTPVRTHIRYHFPRPSETKRIKKHGWAKRMSTPEGRRVLMRRILKGKHCLSH